MEKPCYDTESQNPKMKNKAINLKSSQAILTRTHKNEIKISYHPKYIFK